jgi:hypothetical protein
MPVRKKTKVSREIRAKAQQVLAFTEQRAKQAADQAELFNALFAVNGKATELFPTESERTAFLRTDEYKRLSALINALPWPAVSGHVEFPALPTS